MMARMQVELLSTWTQLERLWLTFEREHGAALEEGGLDEAVAAIGECLRRGAASLAGDDHEAQSRELHLAVSEAHQRWFLVERCLRSLLERGVVDQDACAPDERNVELWRAHACAELDAAGHAVRMRARGRIAQLRRRIDELGFATAPTPASRTTLADTELEPVASS